MRVERFAIFGELKILILEILDFGKTIPPDL